jgi:hypothetical protein
LRLGRVFVLVTALIGGVGISCFNPPSDDVLFSCDPDKASECPDRYVCEDDGCCHRKGSDVDANYGACALSVDGGESGSGGGEETGTGTGTG